MKMTTKRVFVISVPDVHEFYTCNPQFNLLSNLGIIRRGYANDYIIVVPKELEEDLVPYINIMTHAYHYKVRKIVTSKAIMLIASVREEYFPLNNARIGFDCTDTLYADSPLAYAILKMQTHYRIGLGPIVISSNKTTDKAVLDKEIITSFGYISNNGYRNFSSFRYNATASALLGSCLSDMNLKCDECGASTRFIPRYGLSKTLCMSCYTNTTCSSCHSVKAIVGGCRYGNVCTFCRACCRCRKCPCKRSGKVYTSRRRTSCDKCGLCTVHNVCKCRFPAQLIRIPKGNVVAFEYEFPATREGIRQGDFLNFLDNNNLYGDSKRVMTDISCPGGFEYCSGPLSLEKVKEELMHINRFVSKYSDVDYKTTAGFHVHVNCIDIRALDLRSILLNYIQLEEEIMDVFVAPFRASNSYAIPLYAFKDTPDLYEALKETRNPRDIRRLLMGFIYTNMPVGTILKSENKGDNNIFKKVKQYEDSKYANSHSSNSFRELLSTFQDSRRGILNGQNLRYSAFNLHSFFYRGTIEFRAKECSSNVADLFKWTEFCYYFIKVVSSLNPNYQIKSFVELMERIDTYKEKK